MSNSSVTQVHFIPFQVFVVLKPAAGSDHLGNFNHHVLIVCRTANRILSLMSGPGTGAFAAVIRVFAGSVSSQACWSSAARHITGFRVNTSDDQLVVLCCEAAASFVSTNYSESKKDYMHLNVASCVFLPVL